MGGPRFNYYAFGPKVQNDFFVLPKAGVSLSTALHHTYNSESEYEYSGGELQGVLFPNDQSRIPVKLYGQRSVDEITNLIMSEVGEFFDLTNKSRITLSARWGLDLREPSVVIDLNRIEFDGGTYQINIFSVEIIFQPF